MTLSVCALPGNERFAERLLAGLDAQALRLEGRRFPDGESYLRFAGRCAGADLVLVCTLDHPDPKIPALLFAARTARELGARRIGLVAPYLAYMRQDRRFKEGEALTSDCFAGLVCSHFDWLVTVDPHLHRRHALGELYSIPSRVIAAAPALAAWIRCYVKDPVVVGPDEESAQWAAEVAALAHAPHVILSKVRSGDLSVEIHAPPLENRTGGTAVLLDDIVSSGRTMAVAARCLAQKGFKRVIGLGVHGIFAGDARKALCAAGLSRIVTTNTIEGDTADIDVSKLVVPAVAALTRIPV